MASGGHGQVRTGAYIPRASRKRKFPGCAGDTMTGVLRALTIS